MPFINQGIQSLPQELKDLIFDFAFLPASNTNVLVPISSAYHPPPYLSISSKLRAKTVSKYYASSIFTFDNPALGCAWLASVPAVFAKQVQHVGFDPLAPDQETMHEHHYVTVCPEGRELMAVEQLIREYAESRRPKEGVLRVRMRMALREEEREGWQGDLMDVE